MLWWKAMSAQEGMEMVERPYHVFPHYKEEQNSSYDPNQRWEIARN